MTISHDRFRAGGLRLSFTTGLFILAGCPQQPAGSESASGSESESESEAGHGSESGPQETGSGLDCDIPQLFVDRCGGSVCHSAGDSTAAALDLTSPGVEDRVVGVPGLNCGGLLANPASPQDSLLYTKVSESNDCEARMPVAGPWLTDDEMMCLTDWLSGLLPPGPDETETGTETDTETETETETGGLCVPGEAEICYSGPPATEDVGICVGGTRTCLDDGLDWGPCLDQVGPQGENCFTDNIDEDCDGMTPACSELWSQSFGDDTGQSFNSAAVDSNGDIYVIGNFEGEASFGGDPLAADGDKADIVIAKYDHFGNPLWSMRYGDSSNQYGVKLIVDSQDNIIAVGRIYGHIDFGAGELTSEGVSDIAIAKLDSDGNHLWSQNYGGMDNDRAERVIVDSQDNVLLTGAFGGEVDFGGGMFASAGLRDAFVVKIDGDDGSHIFSTQIGGVGDEYGFGVDVDANDNVVVAGRFTQSIEFGGTLDSAGGRDIYMAKLSPVGALLWTDSFGGPGEDGIHDLRVRRSTGEIVMVGFMANSVSFGGGPALVSAGERDIFLATLNQNGGHVWSKRFGDATDQFTLSGGYEDTTWMTLALDAGGAIHVGGALVGTANFGGGDISAAGDTKPDAFYVKLSAAGDFVANDRFGGSASEMGLDIAVTGSGHIVMAGRAFGTMVNFGASGTVLNAGSDDAFLVKLLP